MLKNNALTKYQQEVLDHLVSIKLARMDFWQYCLFHDREFFEKRSFLRLVAVVFQWVYTEYLAGRPRRVSVSMPPRAGKSYICSLFCAWWLGKLPTLSVMRNTCTARLYDKFSYDVRKIVKSAKFMQVFTARLSADKQNLESWNLTEAKQVSYFGAGVGGTIIGFGANIAITDDLYSGMEDALSENYNESVHMWKESDHDSRKERNCPEIYIGTRWTIRDVIGKAIETGKIDRELKIAAMVLNEETGVYETFCDDVKTTAEYLAMKADIEESIWEAEWMQEPIESKGLMFPMSELKKYKRSQVPWEKAEYTFSYVDPADEGGDDLSAPLCVLIDDRIYVKRVIYNKEGTDANEPAVTDMLISNKVNHCQVEGNSAWILFGKAIRKAVRERWEDCEIRIIKNTVNKHTRILAMSRFVINHFYFDEDFNNDKEYKAFMRNLTAYLKVGGAKHDDAPDSIAGCAKFFQSTFPDLW